MVRSYSQLERIEYNDEITPDTHPEFLFHLQHSLLLALSEQGSLSQMQYRRAYDLLCQQRLNRLLKQRKPGDGA